MTGNDWLDLILALGAIWYSFMPPERVPHYRRGIALTLRYAGFFLLLIVIAHWLLRPNR